MEMYEIKRSASNDSILHLTKKTLDVVEIKLIELGKFEEGIKTRVKSFLVNIIKSLLSENREEIDEQVTSLDWNLDGFTYHIREVQKQAIFSLAEQISIEKLQSYVLLL